MSATLEVMEKLRISFIVLLNIAVSSPPRFQNSNTNELSEKDGVHSV